MSGITLCSPAQYGAATVLDLHSGAKTSIPGVLPGASQVVVSPGGVAAALYHATGDLIEIVTGIPAAPIVARTIRPTVLNGRTRLLAISDDGQSLP